MVVRFNQFNNMDNYNFAMGWHGTESNGRPRSVRAYEFYANTYTCSNGGGNCGQTAGARGGTGLVWGNSSNLTSGPVNSFFTLTTYRAAASLGGWGPCDGSTVYDQNDGTTYYSGTISSYNSSTMTITVSGSPGWSTNQWSPNGTPYSVHDVTQNNGSDITANGSNTLTLLAPGPGPWTPAGGDSIQILRATYCLDQAGGRGAGILYSGAPAAPAATANEIVSPTYVWANPFTGGTPGFGSGVSGVTSNTARVIQNRNFYVENTNQAAQSTSTTPFNGTTTIGMGHGTLANRPSSCTTGVGYFAEDQGSWNANSTTVPGISGYTQGDLFLCTATNTWTPYYTPYTYPHPLTTNGTQTTAAPKNVVVTSVQ